MYAPSKGLSGRVFDRLEKSYRASKVAQRLFDNEKWSTVSGQFEMLQCSFHTDQ
jgi:hypothetical protein